jgi:anti-sigma regulatory factor (Ser/Thr protein kinase)
MGDKVFKVPVDALNGHGIDQLMKEFGNFKGVLEGPGDRIVFDLEGCKNADPSGIVTLAAIHDELAESQYKTVVRFGTKGILGFRNHVESIGLIRPNAPMDDNLRQWFEDRSLKLVRCKSYTDIDTASNELYKFVFAKTQAPAKTKAALAYMINEVLGNAASHGYKYYGFDLTHAFPHPVYLCGYTRKEAVEIAILDRGQGIYKSLQQRPENKKISSKQAILHALKNGVTGAPNGSPGFGLWSTAEFIKKNQGELTIWSSWNCYQINATEEKWRKAQSRSTLVRFRLNPQIEIPFEEVVQTDSAEDLLSNWKLET